MAAKPKAKKPAAKKAAKPKAPKKVKAKIVPQPDRPKPAIKKATMMQRVVAIVAKCSGQHLPYYTYELLETDTDTARAICEAAISQAVERELVLHKTDGRYHIHPNVKAANQAAARKAKGVR